jgi:CubicO group peptidase (beta-lactamase class C family)
MSDRLPVSPDPEESSPLGEIAQWSSSAAAAAGTGAHVRFRWGETEAVSKVASITKLATAWAVLVAVEEGAVDLRDEAGPPGSTVAHLLAHTGGFAFDSTDVLAQPGTRRIYSNTGYEALADHVERSTGIRFGSYLAEAVLSPVGMTSTELRGSPAADLHSNVADLVRFVAELRSPTLLHPSTAETFRTVQFAGLPGVLPGFGQFPECDWGFGAEIKGTKVPHWSGDAAPPSTHGHFGASGSFLWIDPVNDAFCVVLSGRPFGEWAVSAWPAFSDRVRARLVD